MAFRQKLAAFLVGVAATAAVAFGAQAADLFDFSPEQKGRVRTVKNEEAVRLIGTDVKFVKEGTLTVAIAPFAPPIAAYATDAKTPVGFDPDYAQLIADALGLKLDLLAIAWADWPLGLASGKYDAVISNVGVTEQRKEKFDFSTYRQGLHGFFVKADSPIASLKEPKSIAGLRIITGSGTIQEKIILEWNKQNVAAGLKPVEVQYYDDDAARLIALAAGRADAIFNPHAPLAYAAARDGKIKLVGTVNAGWPLTADVAITTRKGSGLAEALTAATNGVIQDGSYAKALARWNLQTEALPTSRTNPPGLPKF